MRIRGSITIFMALMILVTLLLFTSIIERARVISIKAEIELNTYNAIRSLAANYHNELWNEYDILGLDMRKDREKQFEEYLNFNTNSRSNKLFKVKYDDINILPNTINENFGSEIIRQAYECMKYRIPSSLINRLKNGEKGEYENVDYKDESGIGKEDIEKARNKKIKDPRKVVDSIKDDNEFTKFANSNKKISNKTLDHKAKKFGNLHNINSIEKLLFNEYILSHFTSIVNCDESDHKISYEVEYILKGYNSDKNNINAVIRDIKLLRMASNCYYIIHNKLYNNIARIAAIILSGFTFNIGIIKATKVAIVTAWAYAESAIDVKTLLSGGKVPIKKTDKSWNLGWDAIFHFWNIKPKNNKNGMSYDDFLRLFLVAKGIKNKVGRVMDLIETNTKVDLSSMAYKFNVFVNYKIDKKLFHPMFIKSNMYKSNIVAAYGYR